MSKDNGGQAFPAAEPGTGGMTLRDWFAGQAMAGLLSCQLHHGGTTYPHEREAADRAFKYADAMIAERAKC